MCTSFKCSLLKKKNNEILTVFREKNILFLQNAEIQKTESRKAEIQNVEFCLMLKDRTSR